MDKLKKVDTEVVLDIETGSMVEITPEARRTASALHDQVLMGAYISAVSLHTICENRHYLALGCQSQEEYFATMVPYSRSQAFNLLKIAAKFQNVFKALSSNGLTESLQLESPKSPINWTADDTPAVSPEEVQKLGFLKLYELTKVDDSDLIELVKTGKFEKNGMQVDWEELKDMTARQTAEKVRDATEKFKRTVKGLSSRVAVLEEEKKLLQRELGEAEATIVHAKDIESRFGAAASRTVEKREQLGRANVAFGDFQELVCRTGITTDDTTALKRELVAMIKSVDEALMVIKEFYGEVLLEMGE